MLGLVVVTIVLVIGLGLGESIAGSLEDAALARFGPVDVVVTSREPFESSLADRVTSAPGPRAQGVEGAATLALTGSVSHPAKELAEAFASVRGVSPAEARALGPLPAPGGGSVPEPERGEVVLSKDLADRIEARVGDLVTLRAPIPGTFPDPAIATVNFTGVTTASALLAEGHVLEVEEDAIGVFVSVQWADAAGPVTVTARAPSGRAWSNASATAPVVLFVPPPVEAGAWTVVVSARLPTPYVGMAGVAYPPPSLAGGLAVIEARVAGIAAAEGRASVTGAPTALVPIEDLQEATGLGDRATALYFRVGPDPYAAADAIEEALDDAEAYRVRAIKADALAQAERAGAEITGFLLVMGGFTLVAAALLAYALFSALVEERRVELGVARALGLTRGEVALAMTLEGALYAGAAALAGLVVGLGLLWGLVSGIARVAEREGGPPFGLDVGAPTVAAAFAVGALIPLGTIAFASLRFARLDPSRAIRGIADDPKEGRRGRLVAAGALVAVGAALSISPIGRLVGVLVACAGAALALSAFGRRALAVGVALAGVLWTVRSLYAFDDFPDGRGELDPIMTMARGLVLALVVASLAVVSPRPYALVTALARLGPRWRRTSLVSLRYLVARRRQTGLTMAMISIVVVVVTIMGTLILLFGGQIPTDEAGYTVIGESPLRLEAYPTPLPADLARDVERTDFLPKHFEFRSTNFTVEGEPIGPPWGFRAFVGADEAVAAANRYELAARADEFATDADAWAAVARGDAVLLPSWIVAEYGPSPGTAVKLRTALGDEREYVVAGGVRTNFVDGAFLAADHVRAMGFPSTTTLAVRVAPGADPSTVAHRLTSEYEAHGVTFVSVPEEVERLSAGVRAVLLVFEAFLALGLFVGLAATGFLAARAVHERARDVGTMRALGFEEGDVRRAFVLESTLTAGVGLAIGVGVGTVVAHSIWWRNIRGEGVAFTPPLLTIVAFSAVVLALAAFAAWGPARRAARLPPALAVRHVE